MARGILAWHNFNRQIAWKYCGGECQICHKHVKRGVIHHYRYPKDWEGESVISLINDGVCVFLCEECHKYKHLDNTMKPCDNCGKDTLHGLDRARGLQMCLEGYSFCHDCFLLIRDNKPNNIIKITQLSKVY